jgi:hypothetical protein
VIFFAIKPDFARLRFQVAGADIDEGGLAGTVLPDDRESVTLVELEVDVVCGDQPAKGQVQRPGFK